MCLCTACHTATHYGLANLRGKADEASTHLRAVTGLPTVAIARHIDEAFATWKRRSTRNWALDLGILTNAGIRLSTPLPASARGEAARTALASPQPQPYRRG